MPSPNLDVTGFQDLTPNRSAETVHLRCNGPTAVDGWADHTLLYNATSDQWMMRHVCNRQGGTVINGAAFTWANFTSHKPISIVGLSCTQCGIAGHVDAYYWVDDPGSTGIDGHDDYTLRH